jgi:DNA repair exonuclease SbcCD ATPase subunit
MDLFSLLIQQYGIVIAIVVMAGYMAFLQMQHVQATRHRDAKQSADRKDLQNAEQRIQNEAQRLVVTSFTPLMEANRKLEEQFRDLLVQHTGLVKDYKYLTELHESTQKKLEQAMREALDFKELAASNEEMAQQMERKLEKHDEETARLRERVGELERRMKEYEDALKAEREAKAKAEAELSEAQDKHAALLASVQQRIDEAVKPLKQRIAELEQLVAQKDRRIAELERQIKNGESNE